MIAEKPPSDFGTLHSTWVTDGAPASYAAEDADAGGVTRRRPAARVLESETRRCYRHRRTHHGAFHATWRETGRGWHSLRREFASELIHQPTKVLGELGGWTEPMTIMKCCQHPDQEQLREALSDRRRAVSGSQQRE